MYLLEMNTLVKGIVCYKYFSFIAAIPTTAISRGLTCVNVHLISPFYSVAMKLSYFYALFPSLENTYIKYTEYCIIYEQKMHIKTRNKSTKSMTKKGIPHARRSRVLCMQSGVNRNRRVYSYVTVFIFDK